MIMQLTYISTISPGVDDAAIEAILAVARRNNRHRDLTGMLLFNGKRFLQHLEGSPSDLERIYDNIRVDPRHRALVELGRQMVPQRTFSGWQMAFHRASNGGVADGSSAALDLADQVGALVAHIDPIIADHFRYFAQTPGTRAA